MSYSEIDPVIRQWAAANAVILFDEWASEETRCYYMSNFAGATCQVVIDAPERDFVQVHVWCVKKVGDRASHKYWDLSANNLRGGLDVAHAFARDLLEP